MISAYIMGAKKVIAIDCFPQRLEMAKKFAKAEVINYKKVNAGETLKETTGSRGPDACIDALGLEDFYTRQNKSSDWKPTIPTFWGK